jgi:WD40 repeat protein
VAFSPDGKTVAAGGSDGRVLLWQTETGRLISQEEGHQGEILASAFGRDSKTLVSAGADGVVRLWDPSTRRPVRTFKGHRGAVRAVAFSPDGKLLATGGDDRAVRLWDSATGKSLAQHNVHTAAITTLAFSPDGQILGSGGHDGRALLCPITPAQLQSYEFQGPVQIPSILFKSSVFALTFTSDSKQIIVAGEGGWLSRFDVANGQRLTSYLGDVWNIRSVVVSPDGSTLVAGGQDGVIRRWKVASGQELIPPGPVGHSAVVVGMAVAPGGRHLATVGLEGTLQLWDARSGQRLQVSRPTWRTPHVRGTQWALAFVPPGDQVATGGSDGVIRVQDRATGKLVREWPAHPDRSPISALACSSDGRIVASAGASDGVLLWDAATGKGIGVCARASRVIRLTFARNDTVLVGGTADGTVCLWDPTGGKRLHVLRGLPGPVEALTVVGGKTLVCGAGLEIQSWDLSGEQPTRQRRWAIEEGRVAALACSPDGETVAVGSWEGWIRLFRLATGEETHRIEHMNRGTLTHLAFLSDGVLASSAYDGVLLWKVPRSP